MTSPSAVVKTSADAMGIGVSADDAVIFSPWSALYDAFNVAILVNKSRLSVYFQCILVAVVRKYDIIDRRFEASLSAGCS